MFYMNYSFVNIVNATAYVKKSQKNHSYILRTLYDLKELGLHVCFSKLKIIIH